MGNVKFKEVKKGDIFSENSHYIVESVGRDTVTVQHVEGKEKVSLSKDYVENLLATADTYQKEVRVGKINKADGTPGIRTIFEGIHSAQVFTVCFEKQSKPKTKKAIATEQADIRTAAINMIAKAKANKKSMEMAYEQALAFVQANPVLDYEPGEDRELRGYKVQFESVDGRYNCMDMDIMAVRPVNINTIKWLVYDGVKYIVV